MPFCQSQGEDLAPTKSTIASDVAIVVVIVAIDVIIAIDVVANSGQRWSTSNLITFTLRSLLVTIGWFQVPVICNPGPAIQPIRNPSDRSIWSHFHFYTVLPHLLADL